MDYKQKYIKYKQKYLELKDSYSNLMTGKLNGGGRCYNYGIQQHFGECWHDAITMLLFQSDVTNKDDKFLNINEKMINDANSVLSELFSPKNIDKNAYMLPELIYTYYLKNRDNRDELMRKIKAFLDISKEYMSGQMLRIQNRNILDISRYPVNDKSLLELDLGEEMFKIKMIDDNYKINIDDIPIYERRLQELEKIPEKLRTEKNKKDIENINFTIDRIKLSEKEHKEKYVEKYKRIYEEIDRLSEEYRKDHDKSTSVLPPEERRARRNSLSASLTCSNHILKLVNIFDGNPRPIKLIGAGGSIDDKIMAIQIINLYMDINSYYFIKYFDLEDIDIEELEELITLMNDPNLIGLHISVKYKEEYHSISTYNCNKTQLLYDDNLSKPIKTSWKDSLLELLNNAKNIKTKLIVKYFGDDKVLSQIPLHELSESKMSIIKELIKDKLPKREYYEKDLEKKIKNQTIQQMSGVKLSEIIKIEKYFKEKLKRELELLPSQKQMEEEYINSRFSSVNMIYFIIKKEKKESEETYIFNNLLSDMEDYKNIEIGIKRLIEIKGIGSTGSDEDFEKIKKLIIELLENDCNIVVLSYIFILPFIKMDIDKIAKNNMIVKLLHEIIKSHPTILEKYGDINNKEINIYLLFLNTQGSINYFEKFDESDIQRLKRLITNNISYYYSSDFSFSDVDGNIKIDKIMNRIKSPEYPKIVDPKTKRDILFNFLLDELTKFDKIYKK